jgi:hypothetical protein
MEIIQLKRKKEKNYLKNKYKNNNLIRILVYIFKLFLK